MKRLSFDINRKIKTDKNDIKKIQGILDYDVTLKMVVIGDCGVGKTSILDRFIVKEFDPNRDSTVGVDFYNVYMSISGSNENNIAKYKYQVWDCAGRESYQSIINSYIRGSQVILFVFDVCNRDSFNHIRDWYQNVLNHVDTQRQFIGLIVGNKADSEGRTITHEEGSRLAESMGTVYFETSAKSDKGIVKLFNGITALCHRYLLECRNSFLPLEQNNNKEKQNNEESNKNCQLQ